jgi:ankyrin
MTPLHVAASRNAGDVAGLLLAKGAKLDAKDKDGMTPFDLAFSGGFRELAALLLPGGTKR